VEGVFGDGRAPELCRQAARILIDARHGGCRRFRRATPRRLAETRSRQGLAEHRLQTAFCRPPIRPLVPSVTHGRPLAGGVDERENPYCVRLDLVDQAVALVRDQLAGVPGTLPVWPSIGKFPSRSAASPNNSSIRQPLADCPQRCSPECRHGPARPPASRRPSRGLRLRPGKLAAQFGATSGESGLDFIVGPPAARPYRRSRRFHLLAQECVIGARLALPLHELAHELAHEDFACPAIPSSSTIREKIRSA
jgi:hypothetical protein